MWSETKEPRRGRGYSTEEEEISWWYVGATIGATTIQREKRNIWETFGARVPSFTEAAKASREVQLEFAEDSDVITEEHASAMHIYMNKKLSVSSTVSYEHIAT